MDQYDILFDDIEFAENPEPRCPVVLLLDTSGSMQGQPIDELNQGLQDFWREVKEDTLAAKRIEVAVVNFGPVNVLQDFAGVNNVEPPKLIANGLTPTGEAVIKACHLLQERKKKYRENGIAYYRPWIVLITDGKPTDDITDATEAILRGESEKALSFFCIGITGADMDALAKLSVREPLKLRGLMFREFFQWLSASLVAVSQSTVGETMPLRTPAGWGEI